MKNYSKISKKTIIKHHLQKISESEFIKILLLRTIGNFLIFSSTFIIIKTFYVPVKQEIKYFFDKLTKKEYILVTDQQEVKPPRGLLTQALKNKNIEFLVPVNTDFSIVIPKIGANAKIIPNIDAGNEKIYLEALNHGVAHALGTAFPGEGGHIFLFAHSTDYFWNVGVYNAIFYLLNKLESQDEINIFYKGYRYVYKVINKKIVDPSQVEYLTQKSNKEFLTLQTCWPPGTTLKRLLVFAVRVAE